MTRGELERLYAAGERDFRRTNLRGANLRGTNLRWTNLYRANLAGADLEGAYLRGANLYKANLGEAYLGEAYLREANLGEAYLGGAYLRGANLEGANLEGANLKEANLRKANFEEANLRGTALDPANMPNCDTKGFEKMQDRNGGEWCIGYRTKNSPWLGGPCYEVGQVRTANAFSTSSDACHPGIYVVPSERQTLEHGGTAVKVLFRPEECHKAGDKWRVRWLIVWEEILSYNDFIPGTISFA